VKSFSYREKKKYYDERCIQPIDPMVNWQHIADMIYEAGMLKRVSREGWKLIGVKNPEHVASHSLRAAQIGYILAKLEGYEKPEEVCSMLVFHDIGETRIGDIHKIACRYLQDDESQAVHDQLQGLEDIGSDLFSLWEQIETRNTVAGVIAKDADLLEMVATAREYERLGYHGARDWIERTSQRLKTSSAKQLLHALTKRHPDTWWKDLKKIEDTR
jgi:putative hydrolase of HD superfamily